MVLKRVANRSQHYVRYSSRKVGMELPRKGVRFIDVKLCGFLFWVPAQFGLCVEVVLLHTELEVFPFFAAAAEFRILRVKAGK